MKRVSLIIEDIRFKNALAKIKVLEKNRIFCGHDIHHLLDVARIAWIYVLENRLDFNKSVIYAAGLLHDVGKYRQYEEKIPHHMSSAQMAKDILADAGYDSKDVCMITEAIFNHRELVTNDRSSLNYILFMADKRSRNCWHCPAEELCDWSDDLKNRTIYD